MAKKSAKSKKPSIDQKETDGFIKFVETNRFVPYALFFLISLFYFGPLLMGDYTLNFTDGLPIYGEKGGSFEYAFNPFSEPMNWQTYMGGHPVSAMLVDYSARFFQSFALIFMYDFTAVILFLLLLTTFAGITMYHFLLVIGVRRLIAMALGTAYMLSPHFMSFTYAGHLSKMGVIAILPLMFLFLYKGVKTGHFRYFFWFGVFITVDIFTPHLQMVHYSLLMSGFFFVYLLVELFLKEKDFKAVSIRVVFYTFMVIMGFGAAARGFVPNYIHTKTDSKRAGLEGEGLTTEIASSWGLHAEEMASLLVPEFGNYDYSSERGQVRHYWGKNVFKINSDYFGGIILVLAFLGVILIRKRGMVIFFFIMMITALAYTFGYSSPVFKLMFHTIPGMKSFRAPSLMLFIAAFSSYAIAGLLLEELFSKKLLNAMTVVWTFFGFAGLFLIGFAAPNVILGPWKALFYSDMPPAKQEILNTNIPEMQSGFLLAFLFFAIVGTLVYLYNKNMLKSQYAVLALIPVFIIDFWRIDKDFLAASKINPDEEMRRHTIAVYEYLRDLPENDFRVMPVYLGSLSSRFRYEGVNMVSGFLDFTLRRYDYLFKSINRYGQPGVQNFLNFMSAKYFVFNQAVQGAVYSADGLSVVENPNALPYLSFHNNTVVKTDEQEMVDLIMTSGIDLHETVMIEDNPPAGFESLLNTDSIAVNAEITVEKFELTDGIIELSLTADSPGFLVFSENYHSGWICTIDGTDSPVVRANYTWQGVYVPEGSHKISFIFHDKVIAMSRKVMFGFMLVMLITGIIVETGAASKLFRGKGNSAAD